MKVEYVIAGIIAIALASGAILYIAAQPAAPVVATADAATSSPQEADLEPSRTAASTSGSKDTVEAPPVKTQTKPGLQKAAELAGIEGYINTDGKPIHIKDFLGKKVVLIDIWTYSCINCQRTL